MNLRQELDDVIDALTTGAIEYAVCGGMALAVHGHPRFTEDLDLLIRSSDLERVKDAVANLGFVIDTGWLRFGVDTPDEIHLYRLVKPEVKEHLILDLICVTPVLESVWDSRSTYQLPGGIVSVVSREGLITMKQISGRDQDHVDIRKLREASDD
jgi:hypothetical protein